MKLAAFLHLGSIMTTARLSAWRSFTSSLVRFGAVLSLRLHGGNGGDVHDIFH